MLRNISIYKLKKLLLYSQYHAFTRILRAKKTYTKKSKIKKGFILAFVPK